MAASNDSRGLESYVPEVATKAVRSLLGHRARVLLLHGPGGVGKSSLLAKFLLDHAEDDTLPFAFIDFDVPSISPSTPTTLLGVAARQLGMQYAPLGPTVDRFIEQGSPTVEGFLALFDSESDGIEVATSTADWGPFLLVLDTFEEAEFRSNGALEPLWQMLDALMSGHPGLRIVLSGRSRPPIPWEPWADLHLEGFDLDSATGFLVHRGVPAELAAKIARRLGGNPLTLSLAASLAESGLETDVETRGRFWLRLDDTAIQGQLVMRILDHIHDERARKLAHPGMVLRRVSPAVIQHVLAGPCGVEVRNEADAAELFAILERETALVRSTSDDALEHRRDVRRVMLDQLLKSEPRKASAIRHAFVEWSETDGPKSARWRAEELFHRYWLAQDDDAIEARWMKGVEDHLEDALAELPIRQRVRLAKRIGVPVSREDLQHADLAHWEEETATFLRLQLQQGSSSVSLLGVLQERTERSRRSPLAAIEARLLLDSDSSEAAEAVIDRALEGGHDNDPMLRIAERVYRSVGRLEDAQAMAEARSSR